jgi:hypothetical protein
MPSRGQTGLSVVRKSIQGSVPEAVVRSGLRMHARAVSKRGPRFCPSFSERLINDAASNLGNRLAFEIFPLRRSL